MKLDVSDVAVIIPAYNEQTVIAQTIKELAAFGYHVICINDGSSDATGKIAQASGATVLKHSINLGQGASLDTGFEFIRRFGKYRYVVTFDADGQHCASEISNLVVEMKSSNVDVILGSRFLNSTYRASWVKKIILKSVAYVSKFTLGMKLTDRHNGFRVINADVLPLIQISDPGFGHADDILYSIKRNKISWKEMPVTIAYTDYSKSKGQPLINIVTILFDRLARHK